MDDGDDRNVWFVRALLILTSCLVAASCMFVWRLTMAVNRLEQRMLAMGDNLVAVTGTAARISGKVDKVMDHVDAVEEKLKGALPVRELENLLDEIRKERGNGTELAPPAKAAVDQEVAHLLTAVRQSDCRYVLHGREVSALVFYANLLGKYKLYEGSLASAEDFIDKVATHSMIGDPYYALIDGKKVPVPDYLREELEKYRAVKQAPEKP